MRLLLLPLALAVILGPVLSPLFTRPAKLCVYAIAHNEIKHAHRYMAAAKGAHQVVIADTGSTDGTQERLRQLGATVYQTVLTPFRFDNARNAALSLVPTDCDLCVAPDMDELLQPGWAEALQQVWQEHQGAVNLVYINLTWSWEADGVTPHARYLLSKVHSRHGYLWRWPAHEAIVWQGEPGAERAVEAPHIQLHHRPDDTKSRGQYLGLLKQGVDENPSDDRMAFLYGRELMNVGRYGEAIVELERYLQLPTALHVPFRMTGQIFISQCHAYLGWLLESKDAAVRAVLEWDVVREPWLQLVRVSADLGDWETAYWGATKALAITELDPNDPDQSYDSSSWGSEPHSLAAEAAFNLGLYETAYQHSKEALSMDPGNSDLQRDADMYKQAALQHRMEGKRKKKNFITLASGQPVKLGQEHLWRKPEAWPEGRM